MTRVFVSYRRQDSESTAGRLYDALRLRCPECQFFMDVDGIQPGQDFARVLSTEVTRADIMLVIIGPGWLTASAPDGTRRLDDAEDFVRTEIRAALTAGLMLVPITILSAAVPAAEELPADIRDLARRQAMALSTSSWKEDVEAIAAQLLAMPEIQQAGTVSAGIRRYIPQRLRALAAVLVLCVAAYVAFTMYQLRHRRQVERIAQGLKYELSLEAVTTAITDMVAAAAAAVDPAVTSQAIEHLKALAVLSTDTTDKGREVRRRAIEAIKGLRQNDLSSDFRSGELKGVDLVDVDLSRAALKGVTLQRGFMIRTDFSAADLTGANLAATWVRNSDFGAATLTGADISEMDWYNAQGFSAEQLGSVNRATLARCPKDERGRAGEPAFRKQLDEDYGFKWEQLGSDRDQLMRWWSIYAQPDGLCDQVDRWLSGA